MEVRYDEGIASHIGPEPCAGLREDVSEASGDVPVAVEFLKLAALPALSG